MKALLIDDSATARQSLRADLEQYCPELELCGEADGVVSGARMVRQLKPDLLFLDVQMGDGSGFDLLEILGEDAPAVIFTTASDEYALRAFRFAAIDYLLKPIVADDLVTAVGKAIRMGAPGKERLALLKQGLQQPERIKRIALHTQDKIHLVEVLDIVRCEADGNYTHIHLQRARPLMVTRTLREFEEMLQGAGFIRVHQSHLVQLAQVKEFVKKDGGYLVLADQSQVPVSTRKRAEVMEILLAR